MTIVRSAAERWRRELAAWALPADLLASVDRSPYAWPAKVFADTARRRPDPVTGPLVRSLLPASGSLLDVGAGTGRLSLPVAQEGRRVVAIEPNDAMADELERLGARCSAPVTVVRRRWPEAAAAAGRHDVVLTANVVYDVGDIAPFLETLQGSATRAVVLELTRRHPWHGLRGYYRTLHGVHLPDGPTVDDLVAVVAEILGLVPQRRDWPSPRSPTFETRAALLELYRTRLCLPEDRSAELAELIGDDIEETTAGVFVLRTPPAGMSTLWWECAPSDQDG